MVLSVLVDRVADPVNAGVLTDGSVEGIYEDNFEILVGGILVDPVRVQHTESSTRTSDSFFSDASNASLVLELVHTMGLGFTVNDTLGDGLLSASTSDLNSVDDVTLLVLVAKATGLIGTSRLGDSYESRELSEVVLRKKKV